MRRCGWMTGLRNEAKTWSGNEARSGNRCGGRNGGHWLCRNRDRIRGRSSPYDPVDGHSKTDSSESRIQNQTSELQKQRQDKDLARG
jgi:hypothetical protein